MRTARWAVVCLLGLMPAAAEEVRLAYVGVAGSMAWKGAQQGLQEANVLGQYSGQTFVLVNVPAEDAAGSDKGLAAVLVAGNAGTLPSLMDSVAAGVPLLNLTADDDALRGDCRPNLLHVAPSARMKADAVAQWRRTSQAEDVRAQAWHSDFVKFAARELNNRFRKAQGVPMDDDAWAGWAAVKMVSEAAVRARSGDPAEILAYLREQLEFDGQKGVPHTFRETGQLGQPLLIVENGKLVAEAPVRGVADTDDLDSLGLTECQ